MKAIADRMHEQRQQELSDIERLRLEIEELGADDAARAARGEAPRPYESTEPPPRPVPKKSGTWKKWFGGE